MPRLPQPLIEFRQARRDKSAMMKRFREIYYLECSRAGKATVHHLEQTSQKLEQAFNKFRISAGPTRPSDDERWRTPAYQPLTTTLQPSEPPPETIPQHLIESFPKEFNPDRAYDHGECDSHTCLVHEMHLAGLYYVDLEDSSLPQKTEWFGHSEAPPEVWDAVRRLIAKESGAMEAEDMRMVKDFRSCHYYEFREIGEEPLYQELVDQARRARKDSEKAYKEQLKAEKKKMIVMVVVLASTRLLVLACYRPLGAGRWALDADCRPLTAS